MKIKFIIGAVLLLVLLMLVFLPDDYLKNKISQNGNTGVKDSVYLIENESITFKKGLSETEIAPGSASKKVTKYFGNEAVGDLNNDKKPDTAFLLTQESGGSGTFFYVAVLLSSGKNYVGTNAILLGDRISPQNTEIKDGKIIVNYADRKAGESFSTAPSLGVSKYLKIESGKLVEIRL